MKHSRPSEVELLLGKLEVTLPVADQATVRRRLNAWYSDRAAESLSKKFSEASGGPIGLSPATTRTHAHENAMGHFSPEGVIYLNPGLIRAPHHCIESVIIHELSI